jgi:tripartite-type tricarboxylate transporter receptor subunit TctC
VATGPQVIAVAAAAPVKDLRELIACAKANPKTVNFGSAGVGTQTHLAAENFAHSAGVDLTHVPYKGESAAITDLMGGQIQLVTPNLCATVQHIQQGRLRALAVTSPTRSPQLPEVPSASEVLPGFENAGWFGLMAPAGTPRDIVMKLNAAAVQGTRSPEFIKRMTDLGYNIIPGSPEDMAKAIQAELKRWGPIVKASGAKVD